MGIDEMVTISEMPTGSHPNGVPIDLGRHVILQSLAVILTTGSNYYLSDMQIWTS
jgi:hypothetical protein